MLTLRSNKRTANNASENERLNAEVVENLKAEVAELRQELVAISQAHATIYFQPDGTIISANDTFLQAMGYELSEIQGRHHRIFVDADYAKGQEYAAFWRELQDGRPKVCEFCRKTKQGGDIWIHAAYMPIVNEHGVVTKVVKHASDITAEVELRAAHEAKLGAISRSQAVIEFELDGTIVDANENFLLTTGYTLDEIRGRHHRMFTTPEYAASTEYKEFWRTLAAGKFASGTFSRVAKDGSEIWIQATYNPILDADGNPSRVVKFANNVTQEHNLRSQLSTAVAESSSQMAATISEISDSVGRTARLVSESETLAKSTSNSTRELEESSRVIEKVVEIIQDLADQTNLLALNATIESARAGDAGRSFAVVAGEVKDLARQTGEATKNIEKSVSNIKRCILGVVESTEKITCSVSDASENMTTIAAAVEEQSVTMSTLSGTASQLRA